MPTFSCIPTLMHFVQVGARRFIWRQLELLLVLIARSVVKSQKYVSTAITGTLPPTSSSSSDLL